MTSYENSFGYDLATNYKLMKEEKKIYEKNCKRYIEWKKVLNK